VAFVRILTPEAALSDAHTPAPERARRLLRCTACGRTVECHARDLERYVRDGWPRCCREVMAYFVEAEPPTR
jgi:hypothetical protein